MVYKREQYVTIIAFDSKRIFIWKNAYIIHDYFQISVFLDE